MKTKKVLKIVLVVFLVIVGIAVGIVIRNADNISAVMDGFKYSEEEIENIRVENQKEVDKELSKYPDLNFRNLTEDEITALSKGIISQDDVPYLVTGRKVYVNGVVMTTEEHEKLLKDEKDNNEEKKETEAKPKENNPSESEQDKTVTEPVTEPEPEPEVAKTNPELEAVLEKFFVLKATFMADIEGRVNGMIAEYKSIPKKERTKAVRSEYASRALSLMAELEPQYDAQFEAVVTELEAVVEKIDGDETLVSTVRQAYKKEKAAIKAKYVSKARKHL